MRASADRFEVCGTCAPLLLAMFLGGCSEGAARESELTFAHDETDAVTLMGDSVGAVATSKGSRIRVVGGHAWIKDYGGDPWLHIVRLSDGQLMSTAGRISDQTGDFEAVTGYGQVPGTQDIGWVYDQGFKRISFGSVDEAGALHISERLELRDTVARLGRIAWLGPDRIVGMSPEEDSRFAIIDGGTGETIRLQKGELLGSDTLPEQARWSASYSYVSICPAPAGEKFAVAYGWVGRIEMFDASAVLRGLADVPFPSSPAFAGQPQGDIRYTPVHSYYSDCVATDSAIYALFAGRRLSDFEVIDEGLGTYVHVFDWDGHLQRVYELDKPALSIAIAEDGVTMYTLGGGEPQSLFRYTLAGDDRLEKGGVVE